MRGVHQLCREHDLGAVRNDPPSHDHSKLNSFVLWWPQWCSTAPRNCACRLLHLHPSVTGQAVIHLLRQQPVGFHRPGGGLGERIELPVWLSYIILASSGHSGPTRVVVNKRAMPWVSSPLSTGSTWGSTCHHGPINPHLYSAQILVLLDGVLLLMASRLQHVSCCRCWVFHATRWMLDLNTHMILECLSSTGSMVISISAPDSGHSPVFVQWKLCHMDHSVSMPLKKCHIARWPWVIQQFLWSKCGCLDGSLERSELRVHRSCITSIVCSSRLNLISLVKWLAPCVGWSWSSSLMVKLAASQST